MSDSHAALRIRTSGRDALAAALVDARGRTLRTFAAYERALPAAGMAIPYSPALNPPRWELGHIGWFQDWWVGRNPQRERGVAADPDVPRRPPRIAAADTWFDSSRVAHRSRWELPLPSAEALREDLARGLDATLALLRDAPQTDEALYFFRLALFHEDMHHEAAVYMAQHLDVPLEGWQPRAHRPVRPLAIGAGVHVLGSAPDGFAFDNELAAHPVPLEAFEIDSAPLPWGPYLEFMAAGGYLRRELWSEDGWAWREQHAAVAPRDVRASGSAWGRRSFGRWIDLDERLPVMNVSAFEADAYARWAGRRLPTEAEWERAAVDAGTTFEHGEVWEWTASDFVPYPAFAAHPYRDYSMPWFGTRRVLRGGSFATQPRMKHPRYRNFFPPDRHDVFAGFRTCAVS